jgi:hypothetical protein
VRDWFDGFYGVATPAKAGTTGCPLPARISAPGFGPARVACNIKHFEEMPTFVADTSFGSVCEIGHRWPGKAN